MKSATRMQSMSMSTTNPNRMVRRCRARRRGPILFPIPKAARHPREALMSLPAPPFNAIREMENYGCGRRCSRRSRRHEIARTRRCKGEAMTLQDRPRYPGPAAGCCAPGRTSSTQRGGEEAGHLGRAVGMWDHRRIGMTGGLFIDAPSRDPRLGERTKPDPHLFLVAARRLVPTKRTASWWATASGTCSPHSGPVPWASDCSRVATAARSSSGRGASPRSTRPRC